MRGVENLVSAVALVVIAVILASAAYIVASRYYSSAVPEPRPQILDARVTYVASGVYRVSATVYMPHTGDVELCLETVDPDTGNPVRLGCINASSVPPGSTTIADTVEIDTSLLESLCGTARPDCPEALASVVALYVGGGRVSSKWPSYDYP